MGYTKLFGTLIASSVWQEDLITKVVWITMLAMQNKEHVVEAAIPGLANLAGVSRDDCERALKKLMAPDPDSRNKDHEGRRIKEVPGGWLILNGEYYQNLMSADDRRKKNAQYQRVCRERKKMVGGIVAITERNPDNPGIPKTTFYDPAKGEMAPPSADYSVVKSEEVRY
jgi:hypothetical protein